MGRRWGKTVLGGDICLSTSAIQGAEVGWFVPTYRNGRPLWRWAESAVAGLKRDKYATVNRNDRIIEFRGGGFLGIFSTDSPDSARGFSFDLAVLDEAARIAEPVFTDAIMPTLADRDGECLLISTPFYRNWFYREWVRGREDGIIQASWQAPTRDNPNPRIQRAAELARLRVPDDTYRQEWLAEFIEEGGTVFRRVDEAAVATRQEGPLPGHTYLVGVDWGKSRDYTVLTIIDISVYPRQLVYLDRFNQIDYQFQLSRLQDVCRRFNPLTVLVEQNNVGVPLVEQLDRMELPIQPFVTTNATKAAIIEGLALDLERGDVLILPDPVLLHELKSFTQELTPSGLARYGAVEGEHDDTVMSLAIANYGARGEADNSWGAL